VRVERVLALGDVDVLGLAAERRGEVAMPSSRASRRATATLSSVVVVMTPVRIETSRLRGTNPSPMPSMPWCPHARFESSAHSAGSTA
jgi:hypothetical protein